VAACLALVNYDSIQEATTANDRDDWRVCYYASQPVPETLGYSKVSGRRTKDSVFVITLASQFWEMNEAHHPRVPETLGYSKVSGTVQNKRCGEAREAFALHSSSLG